MGAEPRRSAERLAVIFGAALLGALTGAIGFIVGLATGEWLAFVLVATVPPMLVRGLYRSTGGELVVASLAGIAAGALMLALSVTGYDT